MRTKSQNEIKDKSQNEIKDKSQNEIEEKSQNEIKEKSQNEIKEKSQNEMRAKSDATKQSGMREAITPEESENLSFRTADIKKKEKNIMSVRPSVYRGGQFSFRCSTTRLIGL